MIDPTLFSKTYCQARARILDVALHDNVHVMTFPLPGYHGPEGEDLALDMVWLGPVRPRAVLMISSGLHGVEGFAGSAAQLGYGLRLAGASLSDGVAVVLVHALNPYGFAHRRRTNEENVDLNRNFIGFPSDIPDAPDYERLHPLLVPAAWRGQEREVADRALEAMWREWGARAFQQAVCQGQHRHNDGLFYGGIKPAWTNDTLRSLIVDLPDSVELLAHIDIHTGLGPYGVGELLYTLPENDDRAVLARQWYADLGLTMAGGTTSSATPVRGTMNNAFRIDAPRTVSVSIEFGTVAFDRMIAALREDNLVHMLDVPDKAARLRATNELDACFNPDDDVWRMAVLERCQAVFDRAMERIGACLATTERGP